MSMHQQSEGIGSTTSIYAPLLEFPENAYLFPRDMGTLLSSSARGGWALY